MTHYRAHFSLLFIKVLRLGETQTKAGEMTRFNLTEKAVYL